MVFCENTPVTTPDRKLKSSRQRHISRRNLTKISLILHMQSVSGKKKIKGKMWYFGVWDATQAAMDQYKAEVDYIQSGRDPRKLATGVAGAATQSGCTVIRLVNSFLTEKDDRMLTGRLSRKMFVQYREACKLIIDSFGGESQVSALVPQDFSALLPSFSKTWGLAMNRRNCWPDQKYIHLRG